MPIIATILALVLTGLAGCGPKYIESSLFADIEKHSVRVVGLMPFVVEPQTTGEIRSGAVEQGATQIVTDLFYRKLLERHLTVMRWQEPETAPPGGETAPPSDLQRAQQVGKQLNAQSVLFGTVSMFSEREGSALGIRKPASVGFTVQLISTEDGHLLWKASYHETQKSLMEDITAFRLFFKRKGRWLTAAELSEDGVERVLAASPWAKLKTD
ncbi:MAG: hypothetical protein HY204_02805 [Nitrospirae bacterium]|nr:hypothetical protein [Nitrospirota bacterium]